MDQLPEESRGSINRDETPTIPSPRASEQRCHCRPDQTPWWKTTVEFVAILIALAVAFIYYRQLGEMTKATVATEQAAHAAQASADAQRLALHLEQRPWMVVRMIGPERFDEVHGAVVPMRVENTGKSPAKNASSDI